MGGAFAGLASRAAGNHNRVPASTKKIVTRTVREYSNLISEMNAEKITKMFLVPSWVVGFATVVMAIDLVTPLNILREPVSQIFGHTVLFGAFLAPLCTTLGVGIALVQRMRRTGTNAGSGRTPGDKGQGRLFLLSYACGFSSWGILIALFRS